MQLIPLNFILFHQSKEGSLHDSLSRFVKQLYPFQVTNMHYFVLV